MKRILQVVGGMNRAGAESMIMNLYRNIDRNKFQFDFVYFTAETCDFDEEILFLGGRILRTQNFLNESVSVLKRSWRLRKIIKEYGPFYAVHSHTLFSTCFHLYVAKLSGVQKRIAHSHNTSDANSSSFIGKIYQSLSKRLIRQYSTDFIACGNAAGNYLFPKIVSSKITFLPNAINLEDFNKPKSTMLKKELKVPPSEFIVLQIGRLSKVKNFKFTIRLASYLKENGFLGYHFVFIGQGEDKNALENLVAEQKLEDCISFLGVRSDIPNLLASADVLIMPSFHEGFPVVLVEAQASGLPAVISDNISKEVDLGLNLISFCGLNESFSIWASEMDRLTRKCRPRFNDIRENLTLKGFSVKESAKKLEEIYEK
jgi:glycosyltransferase EpsF